MNLGSVSPIFSSVGKLLSAFALFFVKHGPAIQKSFMGVVNALQTGIQAAITKIELFVAQTLDKLGVWFIKNGPLITKAIDVIAQAIAATIPFIVSILDTLLPVLGLLQDRFMLTAQMIMQIITGDFSGAFETFKELWINTFEIVTTTVSGAVNWILSFFGTNLTKLSKLWSDKFNEIKTNVATIFNNIKMAISAKIVEIQADFVAGVASWVMTIVNAINDFVTAGEDIIGGVLDGVTNALTAATSVGSTITSAVASWISTVSGAYTSFYNAGKSLLDAVQSGISKNLDAFKTFLADTIKAAINAALAALGLPPIEMGGASLVPPASLGNMATAGAFQSGGGGGSMSMSTMNNRSTFNNFGTYNGNSMTGGNSKIDRLKR